MRSDYKFLFSIHGFHWDPSHVNCQSPLPPSEAAVLTLFQLSLSLSCWAPYHLLFSPRINPPSQLCHVPSLSVWVEEVNPVVISSFYQNRSVVLSINTGYPGKNNNKIVFSLNKNILPLHRQQPRPVFLPILVIAISKESLKGIPLSLAQMSTRPEW